LGQFVASFLATKEATIW